MSLEQNRQLLPAIREAAAIPRIGLRLRDALDPADLPWMQRLSPMEVPQPSRTASENPAYLTILVPYMPKLRGFAQLLQLDAEQAAAESDGERLVADIVACLNIADQLRREPLAVVHPASYGLLHNAVTTMGAIVSQYPSLLNDDQLLLLSARVNAYGDGVSIRLPMSDERMMFEDVVQRSYSDDGNGDGSVIVHRLYEAIAPGTKSDWFIRVTAPLSSGFYASRRELMTKYDVIMKELEGVCRLPLWQCAESPEAAVRRLSDDERRRCLLIPLLVPGIAKLYPLAERATQERDAALVVLALARFRRQHQRWPQRLEELVDDYLSDVPADRFSGAPVKYRYDDRQPVLYSVGADRNDDGGNAPARGERDTAAIWLPPDQASSAPDGDWILWPPPPATHPFVHQQGAANQSPRSAARRS